MCDRLFGGNVEQTGRWEQMILIILFVHVLYFPWHLTSWIQHTH